MTPRDQRPLTIAQNWLGTHTNSQHTRRKYEAQFQQLCEWMIIRDLDLLSVEASDLNEYLSQLAEGTLHLSEESSEKPRLPRTVALTCSVLRSLFKEMVLAGLRDSNPMDFVKAPTEEAPKKETVVSRSSNDWAYRRKFFVETQKLRDDGNIALLRAVVIAELAFWVGLRRSEIATASMADFSLQESGWVIGVKRFGRQQVDFVEVPEPAMKAIFEYRTARNLSASPSPSELEVPLVARLKSEKYIDPWTVANALTLLDKDANEFSLGKRGRTIVALRRELIHRSLEASVTTRSLSKHVRSGYAVRIVEQTLPNRSVSRELEKLAA